MSAKKSLKINIMKTTLNLVFVLLFLSCSFSVFSQLKSDEKTTKSDPTVPIFEIKNDAGQTVFAVYPGGVKIFIDDKLKAAGGGFTVGRLSTGKAAGGDILSVSPGNVNVYIDQTLKAAGGGFTVGRLSTGKAVGDTVNFLEVTPDKTHVNVDANSTTGFSVGRIGGLGFDNFLNITPDNYFIGHGVAPDISTGIKNSVLGYFAGHSLRTGNSNILIGDSAGYSLNGNQNIFIGNNAGYFSAGPVRNVFVGYYAGYKNVNGQYNTYIGNGAGRNGTGYYNTVIGGLAANTNDFGSSNVVIGYVAGRDMVSGNNVYIGMGAGYNNSSDAGGNIFIGQYAGEGLSNQDNRLAIGTRVSGTSSIPLIYGELDNKNVVINGTNPNGKTFWVQGSAGGAENWNATSDRRLKKDIAEINGALEKVLQLKGVCFNWKDTKTHGNKRNIGFIAQDIEEVLPEVVNKSGKYYTVQYAPVTAVLVEAVKEQQKIIEKLENRISELEKTNVDLKAQVSDINDLKSELALLKNIVEQLIPESEQIKNKSEKAK